MPVLNILLTLLNGPVFTPIHCLAMTTDQIHLILGHWGKQYLKSVCAWVGIYYLFMLAGVAGTEKREIGLSSPLLELP